MGFELIPLFLFTVGVAYCWLAAWPGAMITQSIPRIQRRNGKPRTPRPARRWRTT